MMQPAGGHAIMQMQSKGIEGGRDMGAETEAVDLLLEVEELGWLQQYVDADNYRRTCLYLTSTSAYLPEPDDQAVLHTAYSIYSKVGLPPLLSRLACLLSHSGCWDVRLKQPDLVEQVWRLQAPVLMLANHSCVTDGSSGHCFAFCRVAPAQCVQWRVLSCVYLGMKPGEGMARCSDDCLEAGRH